MHTSPLYLPGNLEASVVRGHRAGEFDRATALLHYREPSSSASTYPGQCLGLPELRAGAAKFVTWPLTQFTGPPVANYAIVSGFELPPVPGTAVPEHPLIVMVPLFNDPFIEVQVIFPFGPLLFADAAPLFNVTESTETGTASAATSMHAFRKCPPAPTKFGRRIKFPL